MIGGDCSGCVDCSACAAGAADYGIRIQKGEAMASDPLDALAGLGLGLLEKVGGKAIDLGFGSLEADLMRKIAPNYPPPEPIKQAAPAPPPQTTPAAPPPVSGGGGWSVGKIALAVGAGILGIGLAIAAAVGLSKSK